MYRRIFSIFLAVFLAFGNVTGIQAAEAPKESELYAKAAVLMDAESGRILYEKNGTEALANASTTKILTCIIALEACNLDSEAVVSAYAASQPKVHLGVQEGQKFYIKDLLYGLMLESFNDCAVVIAEHIAGDVTHFAGLMNEKAKEIGCADSYFITPNGLDGKDEKGFHHTTAADLAKIMRYCIKLSPKAAEFLEITGTQQHSFSDISGKAAYSCYNHNAFLQMMEGALSGKTGFTGTAGYCYVGALTRDGRTYIAALLACGWPNNKSYKWADTKKLMTYGIENFYLQDLAAIPIDETRLAPIPVADGQGAVIGEETAAAVSLGSYEGCQSLLLAEGETVTVSYELSKKLCAPIEQGAYVGRIRYMLGEEVLGEYTVTAAERVERIDFAWCFARVAEQLLLTDNYGKILE